MNVDNNYCVYKHISPDGKVYIGITSRYKPELRWGKDGVGYKNNDALYADIQKFGWENFAHEILAQNLTEAEAVAVESSLIKIMQTTNPLIGYNQNEGGSGAYKTLQIKSDNDSVYLVNLYKHQKIVQIHRVKGGINFQANAKAMKRLKPHTYVIYMYLMLHDNSRVWALSSKDAISKTQMSINPYNAAIKELIEKKYLIPGEIQTLNGKFSENVYHLFEDPDLYAV